MLPRRLLPAKTLLALLGFVLVALDCKSTRFGAQNDGPEAKASTGSPASATPAAPSAVVPPPLPPIASAPIQRTLDEQNTIDVFRRVVPSTVFVTQRQIVIDRFRGSAHEVQAGSGSGFLWDDQGHVVTNFHVVKSARSLTVALHSHETFDATVVGVEPRKDIAVLRIKAPASALVPITLPPKGHRVEVGQKALAIGNPFGLDQTLTTGIVSALGREVRGIGGVSIRDMIQTDAAINPGNSGGPLLDSAGRLLGMNTMIYSKSGASDGIGFAVPFSSVARVVPQLIEHGKVTQVGIGVHIDPAQRLEERARVRGVIVLGVMPGTPAAAAGLEGIEQTRSGIRLRDIIVKIDDHVIANYDDLYNTLDHYRAGVEVSVTLKRDGRERVVRLTLVDLE
jgi:S1-C subfamily serine protease